MTHGRVSDVPSPTCTRGALSHRIVAGSVGLLCIAACCALSSTILEAQASPDALHSQNPAYGTVYGTITLSTGAPAARARIQAVGTRDTALADSLGSYTISQLSAGISTLQITRAGLDPLTLRVIVPSGGELRVDVILSQSVAAAPEPLAPVHVVSPTASALDIALGAAPRIPGVWEWTGIIQDAPETTGEPDAFRLLADDPGELMRADGFEETAVDAAMGSPADRVLVDGLPMWNAVHGIGGLTAIDPDVVRGVRISDGSASARSDDALFETAQVQTRETALARPSFGAGFGPMTVRGWFANPIRVGAVDGQLLVAGRRNSDAMTSARSKPSAVADRWADGLAVLTLHHENSNVRLVAVGSGDHLTADVDDAAVSAKSDAGLVSASDRILDVPWQSLTVGAVWTQQLSPSRKLLTRGWDARFTTGMTSGAAAGGTTMSNRARDEGIASEFDLESFAVGASIERIHTSYAADVSSHDSPGNRNLAQTGTDSMLSMNSPYETTADPAVVAAYAERHWGDVRRHWLAMSGIHATSLSGRAPYIEPRFSVSIDLGNRVWMTAGYADTHQFVQALRDVRLTPGALVPVSLPVAAGSAGVPVAAARTLMADVSKVLGSNTGITVDAYDRRFDGLILPASPRTRLASGDAFNVLNGRIIGYGGTVRSTIRNLILHLTYSSQHAILTRASASYFPPHENAQTASAAVEWRAGSATTLRLLSSVGSPFPGIESPANADADASGANVHETDGSADARTLSAAGSTSNPIPGYMRVDIGLSHEWRATRTGRIGLTATLANIFDRSNVAPLLPGNEQGGQQLFALTPRSLMIGFSWRQ